MEVKERGRTVEKEEQQGLKGFEEKVKGQYDGKKGRVK